MCAQGGDFIAVWSAPGVGKMSPRTPNRSRPVRSPGICSGPGWQTSHWAAVFRPILIPGILARKVERRGLPAGTLHVEPS